jgi:predicted transcriptional regulator
MPTTIQISDNVKNFLDKMRIINRESYSEILEFMIEDSLELNSKTKSEIEKSLKNVKNGKVISHEDAKKRLGL